ncbi:pancreatic lipase-related protein 2-like isoform X2 [Dreissena polymorpha]|uniref:pancreatic lipase-related protein 2-like isoform X2 n=1 Tax=Dreissena polymorpha TaxID=45954 RepID=UPI002265097B|nr:pancreatic lipase-related protein 2-like isoform X2 [Dreissena polymorpha]
MASRQRKQTHLFTIIFIFGFTSAAHAKRGASGPSGELPTTVTADPAKGTADSALGLNATTPHPEIHTTIPEPVTPVNHTREVCYEHVGCFNNIPPYDNAFYDLPVSPEQIGIEIFLYTREWPLHNETVPVIYHDLESLRKSHFNQSRPTKFVIHGFNNNKNTKWLHVMKNELLKNADMNVFLVCWGNGSAGLDFNQAVANTRVVAAQLRLLILNMNQLGARMEDIHMIGHSLGAHTSGVVGHRLQTESNLTIGRISGLDPAEPAYEFHHEMIRLDQGDAAYVDVIHTNGAPFIPNGGAGLFQPCGHVDFYVNGGKSQPDCPSLFSGITSFFSFKNDSKESALDSVACSHSRAHGVFTESINSLDCQFLGYPCPGGYTDFQTGKCLDCGQEGCSIMGYSADIWHSSGSMYLNTRTSVPFCGHHYYVEVHMSSHTLNTKGRVEVKLEGTWGTSEWMEVSE